MIRIINNERGAALIVTLLVTVILTLTVTQFLYSTWVDWSMAADFRDNTRAVSIVRSGLDAARTIIIEDLKLDRKNNRMVDSLDENWAQSMAIPVGDNFVFINIKDESGKLDMNRLVNNAGVDERLSEIFQRLLANLGQSDYIPEAIIDWIDSDESGSAEYGYYISLDPPYPCKNNKLDSVQELKRLRYVTPEAFKAISPFVTTRSIGRVNINTASRQVLMALHNGITASMAESVLSAREAAPFLRPDEIKEVPGFAEIYPQIAGLLTVNSDTFSVTSTITIGEVTRTAEAIYSQRTDNNATLIYYRVM